MDTDTKIALVALIAALVGLPAAWLVVPGVSDFVRDRTGRVYDLIRRKHKLPAAIVPTDHYYRLTTQWRGDDWSLDILKDGRNVRPVMAKTGDVSGQCWKLTPIGDVYYRLTSQLPDDRWSLDIENDGRNIDPILAKTAEVSGQAWKLTALQPVT